MPSTRPSVVSLVCGFGHAAALIVVALHLGYSVGPAAYSPLGIGWRYGGLVVVAAVPVWMALRLRLVAPLVALVFTTGYVLGMELAPPGPTFRDVAELERLAEPTGITVVENGLYIVRYTVNASVWTVGFLFLGLTEYTVRTAWSVVPAAGPSLPWFSLPVPRRRAAAVAAAGAVLHAAVMTWFAVRLGVGLSGASAWLVYLFGATGMALLAAVPLYLLVRHLLVVPAAVLTLFVLSDARAELTAGADGPHALYFAGWFVYLGILLLAGGVEYGLRRIDAARRSVPGT